MGRTVVDTARFFMSDRIEPSNAIMEDTVVSSRTRVVAAERTERASMRSIACDGRVRRWQLVKRVWESYEDALVDSAHH